MLTQMAIPEAESAVCDCLVCWCGHQTTLNLVLPMCRYNDGEAVGGVRAVFRRQVRAEECTAASRLRLRDNSHQQAQ